MAFINHDTSVDKKEDYKLKVFLGGLSFDTNDAKIRDHFCQFGNITDIIIMRDPVTSKSRGFGFITYDEARCVDAVMDNRPHMLDGRDVEPKRAIPRDQQTGPTGGMAGKITKVFVGGIKDQTTESDLSNYFSQYGALDGVELVRDRETQKKRGFAFVTFLDWEAVDKACEMKYHNINGVQVELKKARTKSELITGNYAGIVKGEQSQQMSNNYQNMNYGQSNNQQNGQMYGQQGYGYGQQMGYGQQGFNQQSQFAQNSAYGYGYDYSQMYAGMLPIMPVPGTLDATAPVASDMGVVQSSVPGLNTNPSVTNPPQVVDPAYQVPPPPINMQVMPPIAGITALPPTCDQSIGTNANQNQMGQNQQVANQNQQWDQNGQNQNYMGNNQMATNTGNTQVATTPQTSQNQWSQNSQPQRGSGSLGSNYDNTYSGGPQRSTNYSQKSAGPYGGGYGSNQTNGSGDANYARR